MTAAVEALTGGYLCGVRFRIAGKLGPAGPLPLQGMPARVRIDVRVERASARGVFGSRRGRSRDRYESSPGKYRALLQALRIARLQPSRASPSCGIVSALTVDGDQVGGRSARVWVSAKARGTRSTIRCRSFPRGCRPSRRREARCSTRRSSSCS